MTLSKEDMENHQTFDDESLARPYPKEVKFVYNPWWIWVHSIISIGVFVCFLKFEVDLCHSVHFFSGPGIFFSALLLPMIGGTGVWAWNCIRCVLLLGRPIIIISDEGISYRGAEFAFKKKYIAW